MDITFTITLTEEGIPQLMGLLAKMWDNPRPSDQIQVQHGAQGKTVTVHVEPPAAVPQQTAPAEAQQQAVAVPVASPAPSAPASVEDYSVEAIGRAAAAFVDADPTNMDKLLGCLQGMGVQAVTQLPDAAARAEFARRMRELGAKL